MLSHRNQPAPTRAFRKVQQQQYLPLAPTFNARLPSCRRDAPETLTDLDHHHHHHPCATSPAVTATGRTTAVVLKEISRFACPAHLAFHRSLQLGPPLTAGNLSSIVVASEAAVDSENLTYPNATFFVQTARPRPNNSMA